MNAQPGDELRLTFVCQDQFGLAYEFAYARWQVYDSAVETVYEDGDVTPYPHLAGVRPALRTDQIRRPRRSAAGARAENRYSRTEGSLC